MTDGDVFKSADYVREAMAKKEAEKPAGPWVLSVSAEDAAAFEVEWRHAANRPVEFLRHISTGPSWRPIADAPHDRPVVVWAEAHGLPGVVAKWDGASGAWRECQQGQLMLGGNVGWSPPTHFIELPASEPTLERQIDSLNKMPPMILSAEDAAAAAAIKSASNWADRIAARRAQQLEELHKRYGAADDPV
jgi:hypothetical protein